MKNFIILFLALAILPPEAFAVASQTINGNLTVNGKHSVVSTTLGSKPCPVMTEAQRNAIASPASGDCVYNSTTLSLNAYNGSAWKSAGGGVNQWLTSTSYQINDVIIESNRFYICLTAHTSGTFATDLAAVKWQLINASISAKAQNSSSVVATEIQFPNDSLTETATGKYLAVTGNNNLLSNPGFEHTNISFGWTQTAGGNTAETTIRIQGAQSLKATLTAQTLSLYQDSTRYAAQFADGVQGIASVRVKTSVAGIFVCPRQAGATVLTNCATVTSDSKWMLYKVPYVFGATSNGIAIVSGTMASGLVTVGNVTGDVYVDDAYVGTDAGIADVSVITPWQSYTPTFTGFGTVTAIECWHRQNGGSREIRCRWTAGTTTATLGLVSLPSGDVISSSSSTASVVGFAGTSFSGANSTTVLAISGESALKFGSAVTGRTNLTPVDGNVLLSTGQSASFFASVPIANLAGSTQVFASQCGAGCENVYSAKISSTGVVTSESSDFINGNCVVTATNIYTCTYNTSLGLTQPMNCAPVSATYHTSNNTSTSAAFSFQTWNSSHAAAATNSEVVCTKTGADYQSSRTIVGSFKEVPKEVGNNSPKIVRASYGGSGATLTNLVVCSTGTCVETSDPANVFTAPAFNSAGFYTNFTIANGTFANSSEVTCTCRAYYAVPGSVSECDVYWETGDQSIAANSSGGYVGNIVTHTITGTSANNLFQIECTGQAP